MKIEQIYTSCIAEAAYYIESNGEVAIIDPLRDPAPYLERAKKDGAKIKYIFETHFHADFVSGHLDLSKATGAPIIYGPSATAGFDIHVGKDGEDFKLGNITLRLIHTPGHTAGSICIKFEEYLISGDTLFQQSIGRVDLPSGSMKAMEQSINLLKKMDEKLIVYPGHGPKTTIKNEMENNPYF